MGLKNTLTAPEGLSVIGKPVEVEENGTTIDCKVLYVKGEDGIYRYTNLRIDEAPVYIVDANGNAVDGFAHIDEAMDAAESKGYALTVKLNANTETRLVLIYENITLDLNGHILKADYLAAFDGHIIDGSAEKTGMLVTRQNHVDFYAKNKQMPVWTGEGYVFTTVTLQIGDSNKVTSSDVTLSCKPWLEEKGHIFNELLANGAKDNQLSFVVRLEWVKINENTGIEDHVSQDFVFADKDIATMYSGTKGMKFTSSGLDKFEGMKVSLIVISDRGVENVLITYVLSNCASNSESQS